MADNANTRWNPSNPMEYQIKTGEGDDNWTTILTVTGVSDTSGLTINVPEDLSGTGTVTVNATALGESNISIEAHSGYDFNLEINGDYQSTKEIDETIISGTATGGTLTITGTFKKYYTINGTTITYHASENETLATVSGLNENSNASVNGTTISLGENDLKKDTGTTVKIVTVSDDVAGLGFTISLGGASTIGLDSTQAWNNTNGTAKYTQTTTAGWTLANNEITYKAEETKTLITVKGLKENVTPALNDKTVTISSNDLADMNGGLEGEGYTLSVTGVDDEEGKIGFVKDNAKWSDDGRLYQTTQKGWTVSGNTITFTKATELDGTDNPADILVTVTGLNSGTTLAVPGNDGVISIAKSIFGTVADNEADKTITLTQGTVEGAPTYTFALTDNDTVATIDSTTNATLNGPSGGSATIKGRLNDFYTLDSSTQITYHAAKTNQTLATISGLKSGATSGVTLNDSKITITAEALGEESVSISKEEVANSLTYTFELSGANINTTANEVDTDKEYTVSVEGTTATVNGKTKGYYTPADDGVTYHEPADIVVATITGLKDGTVASDITISNSKITLAEKALGSTNIILKDSKDAALNLTMEGIDSDNKVGVGKSGNYWSVSGTTATYQNYDKEYWELRSGSRINYNPAATPVTLLTITGLAEGLVAEEETSGKKDSAKITGITVEDVTTNHKTIITLDKSVLSKDEDTAINITGTDYSADYEIKIEGATNDTLGLDKTGPQWKFDNGVATYYYEQEEGWELEKVGNDWTIKYTAPRKGDNAVILATIDNLNKNLSADSLTSANTASTPSIDSVTGNYSGTFTFDDAWFTGKDVNVSLQSGADYKLQLKDGSGTTSISGFAGKGDFNSNHWRLDDNRTSAVYFNSIGSGYSISGSTIKYISATEETLVTLSGLKGGTLNESLIDTIDSSQGAYNKGYITLVESLLGSNDVSLQYADGASFSLKFSGGANTLGFSGDSVASASDPSYSWSVNSGTFYYQHTVGEGWSITSASVAAHTPAKTENFAEITGLKSTVGKNQIQDASIESTVFKAGTISISPDWLADEDVKLLQIGDATYSLAIANASADTFGFNEADSLNYFALDSVTSSTAYLKHKVEKGWSLAGGASSIVFTKENVSDVAKITNLNNPTVNKDSIAGLAFVTLAADTLTSSTGNVIISKDLISKDATKAVEFSSPQFGVSLQGSSVVAGSVTNGSPSRVEVVGFATSPSAWAVVDNVAAYRFKTDEGWKLEQTAGANTASLGDDVWKITYGGESYTNLVEISGLKTDADTDVKNGLHIATPSADPEDYTQISLDSFVLSEVDGTTVSLTNKNGGKYELALSDGIVTMSSASLTTALNFADSANGSFIVKTTRDNGWVASATTLHGDSLSYTYYEEVDKLELTVNGVNSVNANDNNISLKSSDNGNFVVLGQGALTSLDVNLENKGDKNYKFELADDADEFGDTDGKVGFGADSLEWGRDTDSITANYYSFTGQGWSLNSDGDKIKYFSSEDTRKYLVKVSGLSVNFDPNELSTNGTTIYIGAGGLSNTGITLSNGKDDPTTTYKLAFADSVFTNGETDLTKYGFAYAEPTWKVKDGTAIYYYQKNEGWSLDGNNKINYTAPVEYSLATITGLASSVDASALNSASIVSDPNNTDAKYDGIISLESSWLAPNQNIALKLNSTNEADYKLVFNQDADGDGKADTTFGFGVDSTGSLDSWNLTTSRNAERIRDVGAGWSINADGTAVNYVAASKATIATITNIKDDANISSVNANISVSGNDSSGYTFSISSAILSRDSARANALQYAPDSGIGFSLSFNGDNTTPAQSLSSDGKALGFENKGNTAVDYWTVESTTAIYKHKTGEGWTIGDKDAVITYSPAETTNLAELTGLKSGLKTSSVEPYTIDGIDVTAGGKDITIDRRVLGNTNIKLATNSTISSGEDYKLVIDSSTANSVPTANDDYHIIAASNSVAGTASFDSIRSEYFKLEGNNLVHEGQVTLAPLATITGLAASLTASIESGNVVGLKNSSGSAVVTLNSSDHKVILSGDALKEADVNLTSSEYKLELSNVQTSEYTGKTWTVGKTTATLKANLLSGYSTSADGKKATYTTGKDGVTLLTISGLNATALKENYSADDKTTINGIIVDEGNNTVYVDKALLSTTAAKITGTATNGNKYELAINGTTDNPGEQNFWKITGTTAVYQRAIPAYYSEEADGTIKYHAEQAVKNGTKKNTIYVTIKGLKSGLTVDDLNKYISLNTSGGDIKISPEVLGTSKVTLTNGNTGSSYEFDITTGDTSTAGKEITAVENPKYSDFSWEVSKKTSAVLKGNVSEGYILSSNGKTITYAKAKPNATLLTISGLKNGIAVKNAKTTGADVTETANTLYIVDDNGTEKAISFVKAEYDEKGVVKADAKGKITLPKEMLGTTNIAFKSKDYEFDQIDDLSQKYDPDDNIHQYGTRIYDKDENIDSLLYDHWRIVSNTTAKLTNYTPEYYSFNADKNGIVYHKEAVKKNGSKDIDLITITNLPKGLKLGIDGVGTYENADGTGEFTNYVKLEGNNITVNEVALAKKNIKVTASGYNVALEKAEVLKPQEDTKAFSVSGTTATLKVVISDGYTVENGTNGTTTIKYNAATKGTNAVTISGLAKGLKASGDKIVFTGNDGTPTDAVVIEGDSIKLNKEAFGISSITLSNKGSNSYSLDISGVTNDIGSKDDAEFWIISGTTATLSKGKTAGFAFEVKKDGTVNNNKLVYTSAKATSTLTKITGLKSGLKVSGTLGGDDKIEGITVSNNTITLSQSVLPTSTTGKVTVGSGYTLALATGVPEAKTSDDPSFYTTKVSKTGTTTVTYGTGTPAGYAIEGGKIVYKKEAVPTGSTAITFQITGLKSGLTVKDGKVDGITLGGTDDKEITIDKKVLGTKTVTLTGTGYTLNVSDSVEPTYEWFISGTTATYKMVTPAGYRCDGNTITYSSKKIVDGTALIKLTGLKKGLKVETDGNGKSSIDGIKVTDINDATATEKTVTLDGKVLGTTTVNATFGKKDDTVNYTGYKLKTASDVTAAAKGEQWTINGDTATYRDATTVSKGYSVSEDGKKIIYTPDKLGKALATVKGVNPDLKIENTPSTGGTLTNSKIGTTNNDSTFTEAIILDTDTSTIKIKEAALNESDVTLTSTKYTNLKLEGYTAPTVGAATLNTVASSADKGILVYDSKVKAFYKDEKDTNNTKISYTPDKTLQVTIVGLKNGVSSSDVKVKDTVATIKAGALAQKTVSISNGYTLALDSNDTATSDVTASDGYYWKYENNKATLYQNVAANTYYYNGKTIEYAPTARTINLAEITGLKKDVKFEVPTVAEIDTLQGGSADNENTLGYHTTTGEGASATTTYTPLVEFNKDNGTITLKKDALGTSNISLSSNYKLVLDDSVDTENNVKAKGLLLGTGTNKTTASYYDGTKAYYTLSSDGKSVTYTPFAKDKNTNALVEVKGLKDGVTADDIINIGVNSLPSTNTQFALPQAVLGTTGISLSGTDASKYTLTLADSLGTAVSSLGGTPITDKWRVDDKNLILGKGKTEQWSVSGGTIIYTAESVGATSSDQLAVIQGLGNVTTIPNSVGNGNHIDGITYTPVTESGSKFISLTAEVLPAGDISITSGNYTLKAVGVNSSTLPSYELKLGGKNASVASIRPESYVTEGNNIKYYAESVKAVAEITGLNSKTTADDIILGTSADSLKITLNAAALDTVNVSLNNATGSAYSLVAGTDVIPLLAADSIKSFTVSGNTVYYKNISPEHYDSLPTSFEFHREKSEELAKITGLTNVKLDDSGNIPGVSVSQEYTASVSGSPEVFGEIAIGEEVVGTKDINITGSKYVLSPEGVPEPEVMSGTDSWTTSGTTASYKGKLSAGFTLTNNDKTLKYSKQTAVKELAKVTGVISGTKFNVNIVDNSDDVIRLSGKNLGKVVGLNGLERYGFDIDSDLNDASVNGTAKSDTIAVNGVGVTVSGNAGDDYIKLNGEGDTYIYSSGKDVIANFDDKDVLYWKGLDLTKANITADSLNAYDTFADDIIISLSGGTIILEDYIDKEYKNGTDTLTTNLLINDGEKEKVYELTRTSATAITPKTIESSAYALEGYSDFSLTPTLKDSNVIITGGGDKKK